MKYGSVLLDNTNLDDNSFKQLIEDKRNSDKKLNDLITSKDKLLADCEVLDDIQKYLNDVLLQVEDRQYGTYNGMLF